MSYPVCVVPTIYGPPCRVGWCVWESQARDDFMDGPSRGWARMVSTLCRTVPEGPTRALITALALNFDGSADELLKLVVAVLGAREQ